MTTTLAEAAPRGRRDRLAGRIALRRALRLHAGDNTLPDRRIRVAYLAKGGPYLPAAPSLFCSIAHSCGRGLAGISSHPIGVDIEKIRRRDRALLQIIASRPEISRISRHIRAADHLVTTLWTIKEAVMKATGAGLRIPPRRIRVESFDGRSARVTVAVPNVFPAAFRVTAVRRGRYCVSIAQPEGTDDVPRVDWDKLAGLPAARRANSA